MSFPWTSLHHTPYQLANASAIRCTTAEPGFAILTYLAPAFCSTPPAYRECHVKIPCIMPTPEKKPLTLVATKTPRKILVE